MPLVWQWASSFVLSLADSGLQMLLVSGLGSVHLEPESGEMLLSPLAAVSVSAGRPEQSQSLQESPEPAADLLLSEKVSPFGVELVPGQEDDKAITKQSFSTKLSIRYVSHLQKHLIDNGHSVSCLRSILEKAGRLGGVLGTQALRFQWGTAFHHIFYSFLNQS